MTEHGEIKRLLPHRHPVLLVDRVLEIEPGERIVTVKAVTGSEPCFAGIADAAPPEAYDFPVSLLVESFGQSGALLWLHTLDRAGGVPPGVLVFAQARDCTIEGAARPGDVLRHEVRIDSLKPTSVFLTGETWVADRRIASIGSALAVIRESGSLAPPPTPDRTASPAAATPRGERA